MKKIVTLGAIAAVAGGMMFAQPVFEPSVTLDGSATAKWGVDLDAGQTGFTNDTSGDFKVKLWGDGSRELEEGDGIWAELKVTGKETTINKGKLEGGDWELNEAKLHLGPVYVGVKSGDTQVGEYKFDGAIRSADNDNAKWLNNVGPDKFSQGIVVGFANDSFDLGVDLRSYYDAGASAEYEFDTATGKAKEKTAAATGTNTHYTSAYAIAAEAKIKDSNTFLPGLAVDVGAAYNFNDKYTTKKADDDIKGIPDAKANQLNYFGVDLGALAYTPDTTAEEEAVKQAKEALEQAKKDYDETPTYANRDAVLNAETDLKAAEKDLADAKKVPEIPAKNVHTLGYAFNFAYKLKIDDKFFLKPQVGFTGKNVTATIDQAGEKAFSSNSNNLVVGALFGWGDTADSDAGVYFLNDGDQTKKVTPGISVVAAIPLPTKVALENQSQTNYGKVQAIIVPSVYLGDLVPNLKFAAYSEMAILRGEGDRTGTDHKVVKEAAENKDRTFALALAAGVAYDIKATDDVTITPKAGVRFANTAYNENKINKIAPLSNKPLFEEGYAKMGLGQFASSHTDGNTKNYLNVKFGVDAAGLISNTTFFVEYNSANLLLDADSSDAKDVDANGKDVPFKYYSLKAGTFDVGCKISF